MNNYRLGGGFTEHYSSFEELAKAYGIPPVKKKTSDKDKLKKQQEKFCERHKCRGCGQPMEFLHGSNTMICKNPSCKGIKIERLDAEGNTFVSYLPSYDILDSKGADIANNIFS